VDVLTVPEWSADGIRPQPGVQNSMTGSVCQSWHDDCPAARFEPLDGRNAFDSRQLAAQTETPKPIAVDAR
jgi:hypothetical protein